MRLLFIETIGGGGRALNAGFSVHGGSSGEMGERKPRLSTAPDEVARLSKVLGLLTLRGRRLNEAGVMLRFESDDMAELGRGLGLGL